MLMAGSALAQQTAPEIKFTSVPNFPDLPNGQNFGEVAGVATNSKGNVFVFTRSTPEIAGPVFGQAAAQLYEFDANGKFIPGGISAPLRVWCKKYGVASR